MKPSFVLASSTPLIAFAVAQPPACLMAALGEQGNPGGVEYICSTMQSPTLGNITALCRDDAIKLAYNSFAATCSLLGIQVAPLPEPSTSTSTTTASATAAPTVASSSSVSADATQTPSATTTDGPGESKPASAAAAIAPHALLFTLFGLSTTGLFSVVFL